MDSARLLCTVVVAGGTSHRVGPGGLLIGRQADCDIVANEPTASPRHALVHLTVAGVEVVPLAKQLILLNGRALLHAHVLADGDELRVPGLVLRVEIASAAHDAPVTTPAGELPTRAVVELLPRGGRFVFTVGGRDQPVYLADRRCDLLVALLQPVAGHRAGDFIPDDTLRSVLWPSRPHVAEPELDALIAHCQHELVAAGIAGPQLIERAPGGGAVRLALASGAIVQVVS